VEQVDLGEYKH